MKFENYVLFWSKWLVICTSGSNWHDFFIVQYIWEITTFSMFQIVNLALSIAGLQVSSDRGDCTPLHEVCNGWFVQSYLHHSDRIPSCDAGLGCVLETCPSSWGSSWSGHWTLTVVLRVYNSGFVSWSEWGLFAFLTSMFILFPCYLLVTLRCTSSLKSCVEAFSYQILMLTYFLSGTLCQNPLLFCSYWCLQ